MRVVVTGGSGQLGTHVLRRLLDLREVESITSLDVQPPLVVGAKLEAIHCDVRDPEIGRHFRGADAVIHLAFIVTSKVPPEVFESVNVGGSENVFRAAAAAGVPQIIYSSSIAQYGVVPGHPVPIVETTARIPQPDFPYAFAKHRVETLLDELEEAHANLEIVRLRPAILIGTHFQNPLAKLLGRALDRGVLPVAADNPLQMVWDEDVADAAVLALKQGAHGAFNLGARDPKSFAEIAAATGLRAIRIPRPVLGAASSISHLVSRFAPGDAIDPSWSQNGDVVMVMDCDKARTELGWAPKQDTCADVVRHYLDVSPGRMDPRIAAFIRLAGALFRAEKRPQHDLLGMDARVHLRLTGKGGGDVAFTVSDGQVSVGFGIPRPPTSVATSSASLFKEMVAGKTSFSSAQVAGRVRFHGDTTSSILLSSLFRSLRNAKNVPGIRGRAARRVTAWLAS